MKNKHLTFSLLAAIPLFFLIFFSFAQTKSNPDAIIGKWFTENNKSIVQIYKGSDNKYYGKIVWLKDPNKNGKPKVDDKNPDKKLQSVPLIGLVILNNFTFSGDNRWGNGTIYDPDNGKTYSCKMKLVSEKQLDIRGYIGISAIGRTTTWTRSSL